MPNLSQIVNQLQAQRSRVQSELDRLDAALGALQGKGSRNGRGAIASAKPRRKMSIAARKKIAAAQRTRWAVWKAKQKKAA